MQVGSRVIARAHNEMDLFFDAVGLLAIETDLIPPHIDPNQTPKYVFSRAQIGGAHLWVDKYITGSVWISDELAQAMRDAGLTGVKLDKAPLETI